MKGTRKKYACAGIVIILLLLSACAGGDTQSSEGTQPLTWQEQYDLGVRYLSDGNYEEAIIAFTAAIEIDPRQASAYIGRGDAYANRDNVQENLTAAEADYLVALEIDAQNKSLYEKLANVYLALEQPEKAVEILRRGMEALGDNAPFTDWVDEIMEDGTSIRITDVKPSGSLTAGNTVDLQVTVEYTCPTNRSVVLYAGANWNEMDSYSLSDEEYFPPENSGTYTFTVTGTVPTWVLTAHVNISEYPHTETWSPLTSAYYPVE